MNEIKNGSRLKKKKKTTKSTQMIRVHKTLSIMMEVIENLQMEYIL